MTLVVNLGCPHDDDADVQVVDEQDDVVRAWVRPMPMWWSWPGYAQGDYAGAVVADAGVGVGVASVGGECFGQGLVDRGGDGAVQP